MYQYHFHLFTPVNAHYFNTFRNFLMVVLSILVSFALTCYDRPIISSLCISDWFWEALPVFPRNSKKQCWRFIFRKKRKWGQTFLSSKKSHIAIVEAKCATWPVCSPDLHVKVNLWIDEQIIAMEEVVVEEGADMQTHPGTSTWNYFQGLLFIF